MFVKGIFTHLVLDEILILLLFYNYLFYVAFCYFHYTLSEFLCDNIFFISNAGLVHAVKFLLIFLFINMSTFLFFTLKL